MADSSTILRMEAISKSFPGVQALKDVNFEVSRGEIHALVGENGAGKSTLVKILAGAYQKDKGSIEIEKLSATEQSLWDKKFSEMLIQWAEELEAKGLMAKKALTLFKEELAKVGVSFNACPAF